MKTSAMTIIIILIFTSAAISQHTIFEVEGGVLFPQDTETGTIIGLTAGRMADENLGWAFEAQYFWRTFTKEYTVSETGGATQQETIVTEIENSTKMLPIMGKIIYLSQIAPSLDIRISGGIGYAFLWNTEANYVENVEESNSFSGFAWQLAGGVSIPISRAADFFGDLGYFYSKPSRDAGTTQAGLPQRTEIDMSGLFVRIGVRFYN
jgi:opacity protein-like surface antigen